jgi:cytoskeletal protein CcmA (bactofilin family)
MAKVRVNCPYCQHEQDEAEGAVSTFCRACGQHYNISRQPRKRSVHLPKTSRVVHCRACGFEAKVVPTAMSTQCLGCGTYLDLRDHEVLGFSAEKLSTYGEIFFGPAAQHRSTEVKATKIRVAGKVAARLVADDQIELLEEARVSGQLVAPVVRVARGASAAADSLQAPQVILEGALTVRQIATVTRELRISPTGALEAQLLQVRQAKVEEGGGLKAVVEMYPPAPEQEPESAP